MNDWNERKEAKLFAVTIRENSSTLNNKALDLKSR